MSIEHYLPAADRWFTQGESGEGGFVTALYDLCGKADYSHMKRLNEAFPSHVGAWIARNVMGQPIMGHIYDDYEWVVTPGDEGRGSWLVNRRLKIAVDKPCIKHLFFGGENEITVNEFVHDAIQDEDVAHEKLLYMLRNDDSTLTMNDDGDHPSFYVEFGAIDKKEIIRQMHDVFPDGVLANDAPKE